MEGPRFADNHDRATPRRGRPGGWLRRFLVEEDGPSATEYAILLAVLILGAVGSIGAVGGGMDGIYVSLEAALKAAGM